MKHIIVSLAAALFLVGSTSSHAEDQITDKENSRARMGETKDQTRFRNLVDESSAAYLSIARGPHGEVPKSVLTQALCIGILPGVMTGAFVVGGTHGEGLVSCKGEKNVWSQPATISMNQGSIGLQAGAKSADVVLFFQTKQAVDALKSGKFSFGADVSAVAGTYDSNVNTSDKGVVVYTRSEGLFAGASVNGSKVGKEQDMLDKKLTTQHSLMGGNLLTQEDILKVLRDSSPKSACRS